MLRVEAEHGEQAEQERQAEADRQRHRVETFVQRIAHQLHRVGEGVERADPVQPFVGLAHFPQRVQRGG